MQSLQMLGERPAHGPGSGQLRGIDQCRVVPSGRRARRHLGADQPAPDDHDTSGPGLEDRPKLVGVVNSAKHERSAHTLDEGDIPRADAARDHEAIEPKPRTVAEDDLTPARSTLVAVSPRRHTTPAGAPSIARPARSVARVRNALESRKRS